MNPPSLNVQQACPEVAAAQAAIRLDRMQTEFRRGRPVVMETADPAAPVTILAAVETLSASQLQALVQTAGTPLLLLTAERLRAIGWSQVSGARCPAARAPPHGRTGAATGCGPSGGSHHGRRNGRPDRCAACRCGAGRRAGAVEARATRSRAAAVRTARRGAAGSATRGSAAHRRHRPDRIDPRATRRRNGPDPRQ